MTDHRIVREWAKQFALKDMIESKSSMEKGNKEAFSSQPCNYVQRIQSVKPGFEKMRVETSYGSPFEYARNTLNKEEKRKIVDQMADALTQLHLKYGVAHNLIAKKTLNVSREKNKLKLDFIELSEMKNFVEDEPFRGPKEDFKCIKAQIMNMGKTKKESEALWILFKKTYEEKANKL